MFKSEVIFLISFIYFLLIGIDHFVWLYAFIEFHMIFLEFHAFLEFYALFLSIKFFRDLLNFRFSNFFHNIIGNF